MFFRRIRSALMQQNRFCFSFRVSSLHSLTTTGGGAWLQVHNAAPSAQRHLSTGSHLIALMSEREGAAVMTDKEPKESIFQGVELHAEINNTKHHTSEISVTELIVRRGQPFTLTLRLTKPFDPARHPLSVVAMTGSEPHESLGFISSFGIPPIAKSSPGAKVSWKITLDPSSVPKKGVLSLLITPPANAPIGEYILKAKHRNEDMLLARPVVLFNSWCPEDDVFLPDEEERQEYVMNEQGIIYSGSGNYINSMCWDFAQFEDDMIRICMTLLDVSHKHLDDPVEDVSSRGDPCYVGRVVSAMINCEDDHGVVLGRWDGSYIGGRSPSHWSGSHAILKQWLNLDCHPVRYGQCWVFAGVMCSVMRLLGIPCRVITNFVSAHDTNRNLTIDVYHADYGVPERHSPDSIWNFHVWVEGWMKRPKLPDDGKFDGWQVLDPTPQEMSSGIYCCGPASVKAIREGHVDLQFDVPFVFAEVNADCVDWLVKPDGSKLKIFSDPGRVGQNISTKSVGSRKRWNITDNYKHREGSEKERTVFKYALTRDFTVDEEEEKATGTTAGATTGTSAGAGAATGTSAGATTGTSAGATAGTSAGATTGTSAGATTGTSAGAGAATGTSAGAGAATGTSAGAGAATGTSAGAGAATGTSAGAGAATGTSAGAATGTSASAGAATGTSAGAATGTSAGAATGTSAGAATGTSAGAGAATGTFRGTGAATGTSGRTGATTPDNIPSLPVSMRFKEVTMPLNGKDVKLDLLLWSKSFFPRQLSVNISIQAMKYNGSPGGHIQTVVKEEILPPGKGLTIPVLVPFLSYHKHMVQCNSMKVSAVVTDKENPVDVYLAESDVVLHDPPLSLTVSSPVRLNHLVSCELIFKNPVNETLTECELTMSGSGLLKDENSSKLPDLPPNKQFRIKLSFVPYRKGERTLMADLDCSTFRDIKASCTFIVTP